MIRITPAVAALAILALALFAAPAQAASFDCAQAGTAVEYMICGDDDLSKLDELLGDRYVRALRKGEDPKAVKAAQRAWLRDTRNACADAACLKAAYEARIAELTKIGWMTDEKAQAICGEVVGALNDGSLQERFVEFQRASDEDRTAWLKSDPKNSYRGFLGGLLATDYDGDGAVDLLGKVGTGGTCSMTRIFDFDDGHPPDDEHISDGMSWGVNDRFLMVGGQGVIVKERRWYGTSTILGVFAPTHSVDHHMLCRVGPLPEIKAEIIEQANGELCQAIAEQRLDVMPWRPPSEQLQEHVRTNSDIIGAYDVAGTIMLDLDLDGLEDSAALLEWYSGANCGGDALLMAVVDVESESVPDASLNRFLRGTARGRKSPFEALNRWYFPGVFQFQGRPYIYGGLANPVVSSIWHGEPREWCKFRLLPQHVAYPPNE